MPFLRYFTGTVRYIGDALKKARERAGLTQNALARRVGMTAGRRQLS